MCIRDRKSATSDFSFSTRNSRDILGRSDACTVYRATNKRDKNHSAAVKCVEMWDAYELESLSREFEIMKYCMDHPLIVKLQGVYHDEKNGQLQIVMDLMAGGTLFDAVNKRGQLHEHEARGVMKNMASALGHIHSLGIIHRDIKPENILLRHPDDLSSAMLSDFDMAIADCRSATDKCSLVGTAGYTAPEILRYKDYHYNADTWSMGVVLFVMLIGGMPFPQSERKEAVALICAGFNSDHQTQLAQCGEPARQLVELMLDANKATRLSMAQVGQHAFVTDEAASPAKCAAPPHRQAKHSPNWHGASEKWKQVAKSNTCVFALRRSCKRQPKVQATTAASMVPAPHLMSMDVLKKVITTKHPEKTFGKMTPLASNENCDVYTVQDKKSGQRLVVKAVPCDEMDIEGRSQIMRELQLFASVAEHPYIVSFDSASFTMDDSFLVMQFAAGGEWFDHVQRHGPYREPGAASCCYRLTEALKHVHGLGLIHRDIKLQNVLLETKDPNSVLLSDFDMACQDSVASSEKYGLFGTQGYTAPELGSADYSYKVDIWSLGVCLFMVLSGKHPHFSPGGDEPSADNSRVEFPDEQWEDKSAGAKQLIQAMLEPRAAERMSAVQVGEHAWMSIADPEDKLIEGSAIMSGGAGNSVRQTRRVGTM
eukprot:TRINITY_DN16048_c0_g1_i2.p1 TRINITY_DN16048_c0_g1~~TRINITY_DN16048_c0_g1_i2.p1  ORF type:complete len:654 (-),score=125.65 TRINITY_DN16048_c0_g1_i2:4-1965(-)